MPHKVETERKLSPRDRKALRPRTKLAVDDVLRTNEAIFSKNGQFRLEVHERGDLIILGGTKHRTPYWRAGVTNLGQRRQLAVQADGNLFFTDEKDKVLWESKTAGKGTEDSIVSVTDEGRFIITCEDAGGKDEVQEIYRSPEPRPQDRLMAGQSLTAGQSLLSPNCRVQFLTFRKKGPVLYDWDKEVWSKVELGATTLLMGQDDSVTLYQRWNRDGLVWQTDTRQTVPSGNAVLHVLDEGVFVVKINDKIVWSSDMAKVPPEALEPWRNIANYPTPMPLDSDRIEAGMYILPWTRMTSANKEYTATFAPNAIWTIRRTTTNKVIWKTPTPIEGATRLCISYMGYTILFNAEDEVVYSIRPEWNPEQPGIARDYALVLDNDGYMFVKGYPSANNKWEGRENFKNPPFWAAGIWMPRSLKPISQLLPGQGLSVDQTFTYYDDPTTQTSLIHEFGFTPAGNFYIRDAAAAPGKGIVYYLANGATGSSSNATAGLANLLTFATEGAKMLDEEGRVLWRCDLTEPPGAKSFAGTWLDDPPVFALNSYGIPVIR